jgi:2'-5' RNA ligase
MLGKAGNAVMRSEQKPFSFGHGGSAASVHHRQRHADDLGKSNLFLAIVPEREVALQAVETGRDIARRYGLSKSPRPHELMPVSLNGIGKYPDFPDDIVFAVSAAMATVKAAPFEVNFDRAMHFASAKAVGLNFTYNPRFMPHMTVLYDEMPVPEHVLAEPVRWIAREFVLIRSFIGKSEYEYIDRWPLLD